MVNLTIHETNTILNLSNSQTTRQRVLCIFGANCQFASRSTPLYSAIELKISLDDIQRLEENKQITKLLDLQPELIRETKNSARTPAHVCFIATIENCGRRTSQRYKTNIYEANYTKRR